MSDTSQGGDATKAAADAVAALKNVKEEFTRKQANTDSQLASLKQQNEALMSKLNSFTPASFGAQAPAKEELSDLIYSNPERYTQLIEERATKAAEKNIEGRLNAQARGNSTIASLHAEFPELASNDHELTKKAVEIYSALPDDEKSSPLSYKVAVKEAALELGIKPKSKRTDEEQLMSSGGGSGSRKERKPKISQQTADFAAAVGLDINDPKVKERIEGRQGRNWNKYE